jgi:uncharacterized protein with NAD-binding domain and iron-sulfur cluster
MERRKIAIIGAGIGGMAAAFDLTTKPGWQNEYEVTIYQLGWRLGGQGATGRNARYCNRIEEHGLHLWGGFYENAFQIMRQCYEELGRNPGQPLATIWDAFKPQTSWCIEEFIQGRWIHWPHPFATNSMLPGDGKALTPWEHVKEAIEALIGLVQQTPLSGVLLLATVGRHLPDWVGGLVQKAEALVGITQQQPATFVASEAAPGVVARMEHTFLHLAQGIAKAVGADPQGHDPAVHASMSWLLKEFHKWLFPQLEHLLCTHDETRRLWLVFDMAVAIITGVLDDGVLFNGTSILDEEDFIAWLRRHGASELAIGSALVRGYYCYFFAFLEGDKDRPNLGAGTAIWHLARLLQDYKGAIWWKMIAGMGDTIFAPLYIVLKRRGVRFAFFHRVENLGVSADGKSVETIDVQIQATLKDETRGYEPFVTVKELPCWPSEPLFDQLVQGEELRQQGIDLEDAWSPWPGVSKKQLRKGIDFDQVVLATSMAPLPYITRELAAANEAWRNMIEKVQTTQTVAMQLWFQPDLQSLGWTIDIPLLACYAQPQNTWSDMTHVVPHEDWPANATPGHVSYFCGPWPDARPMPDFADHAFPKRQKELVEIVSRQWLSDNLNHLLPNASLSINPSGMNWDLLVDPANVPGSDRLAAQYWRANIGPFQRYVLTVAGSTKYRMKKGYSCFSNLFLAGDFVFTMLGGCVEGAAMAGRMASRAICGYPEFIPGEVDK